MLFTFFGNDKSSILLECQPEALIKENFKFFDNDTKAKQYIYF